MKTRSFVTRALVGGVIATLTMDLGAALGRRLGLLRGVDPALLFRWFGSVLHGDIVHANIATAPGVAVPPGVGLAIHYLIGTTLAGVYLLLIARVIRRPSVITAIVFGLATNALPWLLMYPAMGFGWFGLHGPADAMLFRTSLINHLAYGLGLGIAVHVWPARRAGFGGDRDHLIPRTGLRKLGQYWHGAGPTLARSQRRAVSGSTVRPEPAPASVTIA